MKKTICFITLIFSFSSWAAEPKASPVTKRKPARATVVSADPDCEAFAQKEIRKAASDSFAKTSPPISGEMGFSFDDINSPGYNDKHQRTITFTTSQFMLDEGYLSGSGATAVVFQNEKGVCSLSKAVDVRLGKN